ncbi:DUF4910 domain-containing protein [Pelagibacterales bacterium SAG-MED02]|nr:DUF4910 domain-containing protein [Pelagibacterales bacterium SAG-MED02]
MKKKIINYFDRLFPLNRSITGKGYQQSIKIISEIIPLKKINFKSGKKIFDWKIPLEWNVETAKIDDENGKNIIDFKKNNLHVIGYSDKVNSLLTFKKLKKNIYFEKKIPNAIPYVTSYYKKRWGFALSYNQFKKLDKNKKFKVHINSSFKKGNLTVGEFLLKGKSKKEIIISSYLCHPSMANNELSGPLTLAFLYNRMKNKKLNYSIRFIICPETIGTIAFLSKYKSKLKKQCIGGYQITCCGLNSKVFFKKSRKGNSLIDLSMIEALKKYKHKFLEFFPHGSDERQYNSPGIDIPFGAFMRVNYDGYKEYHTSLDNKKIMNFSNFIENINILENAILKINKARFYKRNVPLCEPFLSKRNLYSTLSNYTHFSKIDRIVEAIFWIMAYSDGKTSDIEIQKYSKIEKKILDASFNILKKKKLISLL